MLLSSFLFLGPALAAATIDTSDYNINRPSDVRSTACGDIINANQDDDQVWFYASDVIDCLTSLPFLPDVGTRFIRWYNDTIQYHASTAYLTNPPPSYQQPPVNLLAGLQSIQSKINSGYYNNQYTFEADVQTLTQKAHDAHLTLWGGAMFPFAFSSPYYISTVSVDGKKTPKTYIQDHLAACAPPNGTCNYSAISKLNGIATTDYLTAFAQQSSFGYVEPDADWQNLVYTPAQDIVNGFNAFTGGATFYPGDNLTISYENGTDEVVRWIASYSSPGFTGPLSTAGDYYNFFVLGLLPANYNETLQLYIAAQASDNTTDDGEQQYSANLTSWTSVAPAYPDTMSYQADLGLGSPGFLTGYYLDDIKTAVLSIPSFDEYGDGLDTFSEAVVDFITNATSRKAEKVIIDLQQNLGGQVSLVFDTVRLFFPDVVPFAGARRRSFRDANLLGDATTRYFNALNTSTNEYYETVSSEWVATELINAYTGSNFTSWSQLYGPHHYNNDDFSSVSRYNLSSEIFDNSFLGFDFPECYYAGDCTYTAPWAGKDIVLLTDGLCTSACSLFVESMTRAGVHTVVIGGRPQSGPMQAASGSRGASAYSRENIDNDIAYISQFNGTINSTLPSSADSGMDITWAGFTLRDQIRKNNTTPNQFLYLPADCRIYWSLANFNDYTRLWHDAWNAIYGDTSICVEGSRGVSDPPERAAVPHLDSTQYHPGSIAGFVAKGISATSQSSAIELQLDGVLDGPTVRSEVLQFCENADGSQNKAACPGAKCSRVAFACVQNTGNSCFTGKCQGTPNSVFRWVCEKGCTVSNVKGPCGSYASCIGDNVVSGSKNVPGPKGVRTLQSGHCVPYTGRTATVRKDCSALSTNAQIEALIKSRPQ